MSRTRSLFLSMAAAVVGLVGCGDREPEARPPTVPSPVAAPSRSVAELTGWPAGLGRALVLRLTAPEETYRLIVPELGDRRFADSSISMMVGDSVPVVLLGRWGKAGDARVRVVDAEAGAGPCVTWPSAEIVAASFGGRAGAAAWRVAAERDSVTPVVVDSLLGMREVDSLSLTRAINSLLPDVPPLADSTLRGIPFAILRAHSFRVSGISVVVAELARRSSTEADPREQRLFLVGERTTDEQAHRLVYSSDATGPADGTQVTELLVAVASRQSRRPILVLGVEGRSGMRLRLVQRVGRWQWRNSWTSVVTFC
ncbi:MAG: hypothetical protein ACR2L6_10455 [Gemmatimonadaceae bacterium]